MELIIQLISAVYNFLWGDLFTIPLPGGNSMGVSLLVLLLIPTGIYFTIRTRAMPLRLFPEMLRVTVEKRSHSHLGSISGLQALVVSTANLVGVVAAISACGAGAVFWMWISALLGSSTAFIEATLSQLYKQKDPLYGGYRGGPAYYIHQYAERKLGGKPRRYSVVAVLFAISGLICCHQQLGLQLLPERLQYPASVLHRPVGGSGRRHCAAEKCQCQGAGCAGPHHGRLLLPDHHFPAYQERRTAALCVPAYL